MATARKLPSGNWRVRVYAGKDASGKDITESFTAPTKREAEAIAAEWNAERKLRKKKNQSMTLDEALEQYIETCSIAGMSPSTLRGYISSRQNAFPLISQKLIFSLSTIDIQRQINERAKSVSPKTIRNEYGLLMSTLKQYRPDLDLHSIKLPKQQKSEMKIPTDEEIRIMLEDSKDKNDIYLAILLAAFMGLRRSEICALRWNDIDTKDHTLFVHQAYVSDDKGKFHLKETKTAAGTRYLAISDAVYTELMRRRSLSDRIINSTPNAITEKFERMKKRTGIDCRFHDLRHYHASVMLAVGAPEKYIVADMGHSTFDMVRKVYGHIISEKRATINEEVNIHTEKVLSGDDFWESLPQNLPQKK